LSGGLLGEIAVDFVKILRRQPQFTEKNGFVIPTKAFVKKRITKIFCYNNKMFISINKTLGCCSKSFG